MGFNLLTQIFEQSVREVNEVTSRTILLRSRRYKTGTSFFVTVFISSENVIRKKCFTILQFMLETKQHLINDRMDIQVKHIF